MSKPLYVNRYVIRTLRLHRRYATLASMVYMSMIMSLFMSLLITAVNSGLEGNFLLRVWHSYQLSVPCAVLCTIAVKPVVSWLVKTTVQNDEREENLI